jgi:hypothetical protein
MRHITFIIYFNYQAQIPSKLGETPRIGVGNQALASITNAGGANALGVLGQYPAAWVLRAARISMSS